jgi:uncharacterized membrane protein YozB (DUF420 family)
MIMADTIAGIWLVASALKHVLFWHERFGGPDSHYWLLYVPLFSAHTALALATISLGGYDFYLRFHRIRMGTWAPCHPDDRCIAVWGNCSSGPSSAPWRRRIQSLSCCSCGT